MKFSQKDLERVVIVVIATFVVLALIAFRGLGNAVASLALFVILLVSPFYCDSQTRFKLIPWLDSLNETKEEQNVDGYSRNTDDFPLWIRVTIWVFLGFVGAVAWSYIVPFIIGLPLWLSRLMGAAGWKSLASSDGVWQWGWAVVFLVSYLIDFFVGFINESYDPKFSDRFKYPDK